MGLRNLFQRSLCISKVAVGLCVAALVLMPLVNVSYSQAKSKALSTEVGCTPIVEGFDSVAGLAAAGWSLQNLSDPGPGTTPNWFQGNAANFPAQAGATNAYASAIYSNGSGLSTLSVWMISPEIDLANGQQMSFFTRTSTPGDPVFPDRMQVRLSSAGASTSVGPGATGVGDFSNLLLDINPTYSTVDYPSTWTQYTVTVAGLSAPTTGRFAFRYFVEAGGPNGNNSDVIGVDTVTIGCPAVQSSASISGRVVNESGRGMASIVVTLTDGVTTKIGRTSSFGYFTFADLPLNVQYTITPEARRYSFTSQQVTPTGNVSGMLFAGTPNP